MEVTFEAIQKANESIKTTDIEGKEYAEVNQRIKAFRMVYPLGFIRTQLVSNNAGVAVFRAEVGIGEIVIGTGTAYEKEGSSFINSTSYIENCETSAVGRALGMAGFGIDTSVASAEEVQNAQLNQKKEEPKASPKQIAILAKAYTGKNLEKLLSMNNVSSLEQLTVKKASELIGRLNG